MGRQGHVHKQAWVVGVCFTGLCLAAVAAAPAATPASLTAEKADLVYKFAKFVEWPRDVLPESKEPFVIGILGEDPIWKDLVQVIRNRTVHGRPLTVKRISNVEEIAGCHILFIAEAEADRWVRLISRLRTRGILTVSDLDGFTGRNGMVEIFEKEGKVRFRCNLDAAEAGGLRISSKVLSLGAVD